MGAAQAKPACKHTIATRKCYQYNTIHYQAITGRVAVVTRNYAHIIITRRVPVQRAVERDEIPYPYNVHDTTLRLLLTITIKSTIVVRNRSRSCGGGDICGTTSAKRSHVNIATVAMRNSF